MTVRRRKTSTIEIDGGKFTHVRASLVGGATYAMQVKNTQTGQITERVDRSPRWALLDALIAAGCPRAEATRVARNYPEW